MSDKSPVPPGALLEIDPTLIDEGKFMEVMTARLRQAYRDLLSYEEETQDRTSKVVTTAKITVCRIPNVENHFEVSYCVSNAIPSATRNSVVKEANGRLLCQPAGSNSDTPDQQLYFDSRGRIIGGPDDVDLATGEERKHVAGKIDRKQA